MIEFVNAIALANALRAAAKAHHEFETASGKADEQWPDWYAKFIAERIHGPVHQSTPSTRMRSN